MWEENIYTLLDDLHQRVKKLEALGSSVPPGSESALRSPFSSDKPPLPSPHNSEIPERGNGPREQWNLLGELARVKGELDAANQHVKILETGWNGPLATCLRSCAQTIMENRMDGPGAAGYLQKYADGVEGPRRRTPAGGPPTPDPAAQPDSTYEPAYQSINRLERPKAESEHCQRIGVHDYDSLVGCLRTNYKMAFPGEWSGDPQDMIQRMAAEIQNWRRDADKHNA
jgi:hypothetical protein